MHDAIVRINGKEYIVEENTPVVELLAIAGITTEYPYVLDAECFNDEIELDDLADWYGDLVTVEYAKGGQLYSAAQSKAVKKPNPIQAPGHAGEGVRQVPVQLTLTSENKKEESNMTGANLTAKIGLEFGKVETFAVKRSILGIAIRENGGKFVAYDKEKGTLTDVSDMLVDFGAEYIYAMPVAKAEVGDLIRQNHEYLYVKEVSEGRTIVVNPANGREEILVPHKNMFGFNFITKIVDLFGGIMQTNDATPDSPFGSMMLPLLLSGDKKNNDLLPLLMMGGLGGGDADMQKILPLLLMGDKVDPIMLMAMQGGGDMQKMLPLLLMKDGNTNDLLPLLLMGGGDIFGGMFGKPATSVAVSASKVGRPSTK